MYHPLNDRRDGMKRISLILVIVILLTGCANGNDQLDRALALRSKVQQKQVTFDVDMTADYGDKTYDFSMSCKGDTTGNLTFTVTAPKTIAGITGTVSRGTGKLTFDDQMLAFEILSDGLLSPVCGPWVMLKALQSGYLTSCGEENAELRVTIDDSYQDKALHLDIWLRADDIPVRCEIYWEGRRLLTMVVKNFAFV
jgi:hypothetical protein